MVGVAIPEEVELLARKETWVLWDLQVHQDKLELLEVPVYRVLKEDLVLLEIGAEQDYLGYRARREKKDHRAHLALLEILVHKAEVEDEVILVLMAPQDLLVLSDLRVLQVHEVLLELMEYQAKREQQGPQERMDKMERRVIRELLVFAVSQDNKVLRDPLANQEWQVEMAKVEHLETQGLMENQEPLDLRDHRVHLVQMD